MKHEGDIRQDRDRGFGLGLGSESNPAKRQTKTSELPVQSLWRSGGTVIFSKSPNLCEKFTEDRE